MIKSMTAYAAAEVDMGAATVHCELRSVNHRYLDVAVKLPERLRFAEAPVRALIGEAVSRGKVECALVLRPAKHPAGLCVNEAAVRDLLAAARGIEGLMAAAAPFSALEVLAFPGVQQEAVLDKDAVLDGIVAATRQALAEFVRVREREGAQLGQMLEERCAKVRAQAQAAGQRLPKVLEAMRNKLRDRVCELVAQPDFERLEQELALMANKLDVAEELDRLNAHAAELLRVIAQQEPAGRRLDFLLQELNREANTLGAKSADKEMTQIAIALKVLIEQMREQAQNIE